MNIEDELKHKACNIDLFAKKAAEDVAALGQYSGWLLNRTNQIQMEMEMLREQNKKLKEALGFYAEEQIYQVYSEGIPTEVEQDGGSFARYALQECEL